MFSIRLSEAKEDRMKIPNITSDKLNNKYFSIMLCITYTTTDCLLLWMPISTKQSQP